MKKFEELVSLINTKHLEWKSLSVRGLRDISGYSLDASRQALNVLKPNSTQTPKPKQKIIKKDQGHFNPPETDDFIDDPDELLMSVSMRELNKPNPDSRWASILISVRKENIGKSKKEGKIRSKFKSMNIKDIAKILHAKQKDTSLTQDSEESS